MKTGRNLYAALNNFLLSSSIYFTVAIFLWWSGVGQIISFVWVIVHVIYSSVRGQTFIQIITFNPVTVLYYSYSNSSCFRQVLFRRVLFRVGLMLPREICNGSVQIGGIKAELMTISFG